MRTLIGIAIFLWFTIGPGAAQEASAVAENCRSIRDLRDQYRGVELTEYQKKIKTELVAYYRANCRQRIGRSKGPPQ